MQIIPQQNFTIHFLVPKHQQIVTSTNGINLFKENNFDSFNGKIMDLPSFKGNVMHSEPKTVIQSLAAFGAFVFGIVKASEGTDTRLDLNKTAVDMFEEYNSRNRQPSLAEQAQGKTENNIEGEQVVAGEEDEIQNGSKILDGKYFVKNTEIQCNNDTDEKLSNGGAQDTQEVKASRKELVKKGGKKSLEEKELRIIAEELTISDDNIYNNFITLCNNTILFKSDGITTNKIIMAEILSELKKQVQTDETIAILTDKINDKFFKRNENIQKITDNNNGTEINSIHKVVEDSQAKLTNLAMDVTHVPSIISSQDGTINIKLTGKILPEEQLARKRRYRIKREDLQINKMRDEEIKEDPNLYKLEGDHIYYRKFGLYSRDRYVDQIYMEMRSVVQNTRKEKSPQYAVDFFISPAKPIKEKYILEEINKYAPEDPMAYKKITPSRSKQVTQLLNSGLFNGWFSTHSAMRFIERFIDFSDTSYGSLEDQVECKLGMFKTLMDDYFANQPIIYNIREYSSNDTKNPVTYNFSIKIDPAKASQNIKDDIKPLGDAYIKVVFAKKKGIDVRRSDSYMIKTIYQC